MNDEPTYRKWSRRTGGLKVCPKCRHAHKAVQWINGKTRRAKVCAKCGAALPAALTYPKKARRHWYVREFNPPTGATIDHSCDSSEDADEFIRRKLREYTPNPLHTELAEHVGSLIRQIDADNREDAIDRLIEALGGDPTPRSLKPIAWDEARDIVCGELRDAGLSDVYVANMARVLTDFRVVSGVGTLPGIDPDAIAMYRRLRLAGGWKRDGRTVRAVGGRAVNGDLRTLSAFLTRAVRKGWVGRNVLQGAADAKVKVPTIRVDYMPNADLWRLVEAAGETWLRAFIVLAYYTGARRADLLALAWERDVDLNGSKVKPEGLIGPHVYIVGSKADTPHWTPLHAEAVQALQQLRRAPVVDPKLFPIKQTRNRASYVSHRFAQLCIQAGLTVTVDRGGQTIVKNRWTLHDLRRKANTDLRNRGASPKERAALLGHRTTAVNEAHYEAILAGRGRQLIDSLPPLGAAG